MSCTVLVLQAAACGRGKPIEHQPRPAPAPAFGVTINVPDKLTRIESGEHDSLGRPVKVACIECHSQRESSVPRATADLDEFHKGLRFQHGTLQCVSCHQPGAHDQLRLASGESIPLVEVMTLCAQCHGPQFRDYKRGAHGGMRGYWDLSRGPRNRNNCVDCHDPHSPAYPSVQPAAAPRSRFSSADSKEAAHE